MGSVQVGESAGPPGTKRRAQRESDGPCVCKRVCDYMSFVVRVSHSSGGWGGWGGGARRDEKFLPVCLQVGEETLACRRTTRFGGVLRLRDRKSVV